MAASAGGATQNIPVRLNRSILAQGQDLAAKRNISFNGLLAEHIETLVGEENAYEEAQRRALALLDRGVHLGGPIESTRDDSHERLGVCRFEHPAPAPEGGGS
jgi:hypothetical protein